IDRCPPPPRDAGGGRRVNPVTITAPLKKDFTVEDVRARAEATLRECLVNGATRMRTQVEIDPAVGLRGFEAVHSLIADYRWAIDLEICVFPQDGLTNYPGTEELLVAALKAGAPVVGGHMAKLSLLPPEAVAALARRLADAGIAVTVLPATDLYLMGRERDHGVVRGVADANFLAANGVTCSLSSNNILNPATPYGD